MSFRHVHVVKVGAGPTIYAHFSSRVLFNHISLATFYTTYNEDVQEMAMWDVFLIFFNGGYKKRKIE